MNEMAFYEHLRQYRLEVLNIPQDKAAQMMNIEQSTLSNYELGRRQIPIDMLVLWKQKYEIDDGTFINMLLDRDKVADLIREESTELRAQYEDRVTIELMQFLELYPNLQEHLHTLSTLPTARQKKNVEGLINLIKAVKHFT